MSMDKATVARVARLARLKVSDDRLAPLAAELDQIIGWVEQLNEVDTSDVKPMTSAVAVTLRWRADEVTDGGAPDKVLANAPAAQHGFFAVPKVVE